MRVKPEDKKTTDMTPGPAEYLPKVTVALKASPGWGFGTSKRQPLGSSKAPGPGEYVPFNPNVVSPRAGFGTSLRSQHARGMGSTPGPGAYNPLRPADTTHLSATIAGSRPDEGMRMAHQTPGPAAYSSNGRIQATKPPSWGFGTAARISGATSASSAAPGPGAYEQPPAFHGPKISITPRREPYDEY